MEWAGSNEDLTDQDKPASDSNLLAQDEAFVKPLSGEEAVTSTTTENDRVDKPLTSIDSKPLNKTTLSSSDDSTASFDVVPGHSMNREELMKAVFEDDNSNNTKQVTGQNSTQENIFADSPFNPDDWVEIPNDDLI